MRYLLLLLMLLPFGVGLTLFVVALDVPTQNGPTQNGPTQNGDVGTKSPAELAHVLRDVASALASGGWESLRHRGGGPTGVNALTGMWRSASESSSAPARRVAVDAVIADGGLHQVTLSLQPALTEPTHKLMLRRDPGRTDTEISVAGGSVARFGSDTPAVADRGDTARAVREIFNRLALLMDLGSGVSDAESRTGESRTGLDQCIVRRSPSVR